MLLEAIRTPDESILRTDKSACKSGIRIIEDNTIPTSIASTILRERKIAIGRRMTNPEIKQRRSVDFLISSNTAITHGIG
jgi:hypothetical protein|tara:strand:- start:755 stop:994 length:240 start_codon:yes stop_codon:yes gene_type:complete